MRNRRENSDNTCGLGFSTCIKLKPNERKGVESQLTRFEELIGQV